MRCLTRYILREFFKVFTVGLTGMIFLIVLGLVGQESYRNGLTPLNMLRLIPFALPKALLYAIPATTLFAACSVYGRMAADNELVAVKSCGVSPLTVLWPTVAASFLISLSVVAMTDVAVTWGRHGVRRVLLESVEQIVYGTLRTQRSYSGDRFSINVVAVDGKRLVDPTVTFRSASGGFDCTAEEATLSSDTAAESLCISLVNWELETHGGEVMRHPGKYDIFLPLTDVATRAGDSDRPQDIAMRLLGSQVTEQKDRIEQLKQDFAARAALELVVGDFDAAVSSSWNQRQQTLKTAEERLHRLHTEPWRRWAIGFSCSAFVVVGAPLAMRMRNSDVWTSFAVCFLPILAIYYPLLAFGVDQSKSGALPPYSVWTGNLVLAVCGSLLTKRVVRF